MGYCWQTEQKSFQSPQLKWSHRYHRDAGTDFLKTRPVVRSLKRQIFSQISSEGSGKKKIWIFPTGLEVHLESKFFLLKSCTELSNQVLSFSVCQICQQFQKGVRESVFNFFDIRWSRLNRINDFKAISRTAFFFVSVK